MKANQQQRLFEVRASLRHPLPAAIEILKGVLIGFGFSSAEIVEEEDRGLRSIAVYCDTQAKAVKFEHRLKRLKIPGLKVSVQMLKTDDWLTRWKNDWKPFRLTPALDVVPVWCRSDYRVKRRSFILLDTVSSFGTGLHETTQFMAEFIEDLRGKFANVLDVGTGTGILALVALKHGVADVTAIDFDEMCITAANANFKVNGYDGRGRIIHSDVQSFKPSGRFDLVCANLVTHDLIVMKRKIISFVKPNGWLAISGISLDNLPELRRAFAGLPLTCVRIKKGKSWAALLWKKELSSAEPSAKRASLRS